MKTRTTLINAMLLITLVAGVSMLIATWRAPQVKAIQDSEDRPNPFGFIELAAGQNARLNVVNLQPVPEPDSRRPDPDASQRVRMVFDVYIQDEENTPACGGVVPVPPTCLMRSRFLRRESREVDLRTGQAASLAFTAVEGARLVAFIQSLGGPDTLPTDQFTPEPHLVPSLEVREGTRTLFVIPAVVKGFNPQPDPPGLSR
jgi:hypothetical protein